MLIAPSIFPNEIEPSSFMLYSIGWPFKVADSKTVPSLAATVI